MAVDKNKKKDDAANDAANDKKDGVKADETSDKADEPADKPKTYSQADLDALLKKAEKAAEKAAEKKIAEAEAKAKLSEDERKDKDLKDAQDALLERDTRDAVTEAAEKAGVKNPRLFYNAYKSELEFDTAGKLTNLKDVLESAKTEAAELFTSIEKPAGGADGGSGNGKTTTLTKEAIEKMSTKEIADNMEAVDAFLATQK